MQISRKRRIFGSQQMIPFTLIPGFVVVSVRSAPLLSDEITSRIIHRSDQSDAADGIVAERGQSSEFITLVISTALFNSVIDGTQTQ
jgi:hypothetical protein